MIPSNKLLSDTLRKRLFTKERVPREGIVEEIICNICHYPISFVSEIEFDEMRFNTMELANIVEDRLNEHYEEHLIQAFKLSRVHAYRNCKIEQEIDQDFHAFTRLILGASIEKEKEIITLDNLRWVAHKKDWTISESELTEQQKAWRKSKIGDLRSDIDNFKHEYYCGGVDPALEGAETTGFEIEKRWKEIKDEKK